MGFVLSSKRPYTYTATLIRQHKRVFHQACRNIPVEIESNRTRYVVGVLSPRPMNPKKKVEKLALKGSLNRHYHDKHPAGGQSILYNMLEHKHREMIRPTNRSRDCKRRLGHCHYKLHYGRRLRPRKEPKKQSKCKNKALIQKWRRLRCWIEIQRSVVGVRRSCQ
jgi:hypothetical protein